MSKIALTPNASGTGTLTVAAPNTNTDRTLTLPDVTTTLVGTDATQTLTNKSIAASQLTGALPAIDGSALTGIVTGGMTLLGTLTTTSGSTQTLSGLTLTSYKQLSLIFNRVSGTDINPEIRLNGIMIAQPRADATFVVLGSGIVDFNTGLFVASTVVYNASSVLQGYTQTLAGASGLTTASTSISFTISAGTFDAGSILIYGVK